MSTLTPEVLMLLTDWFRRVRESQRTHYECGTHFRRLHYVLGIPAIVLSAVVGTAVFASLAETTPTTWSRIIVGLVSIVAAVAASLQTFLKYGETADMHRVAGAQYGAIRRSLELLKTMPPSTMEEMQVQITTIKDLMDRLASEAPGVPSRMKDRIDKELKSKDHKRIFDLAKDPA
jgi:uncharacterized protein YqhQ